MVITIKRLYKTDTSIIGELLVNGIFECFTLEDIERPVKIKGETAIPKGTYTINMNRVSPRFSKVKQYDFIQGKLPYLEAVPGYEGILIHIGNTAKDTDGCILVGKNKVKGQVLDSRITFNALMDIIKNEKEITINIG